MTEAPLATATTQATSGARNSSGGSDVPQTATAAAASPDDDLGEQVQQARNDPARLRSLLADYASETEPDRRGALLAILGSVGGDDVMQFALRQAASNDPATRRAGLELLAGFTLDQAPIRELLANQLRKESDPGMQVQLIQMLQPAAVPTEDIRPLLQMLEHLGSNAEPAVRTASIRQLAQWGHGRSTEDVMQQALLDPDPEVRRAGIDGVDAGNLRSSGIKDILLDIAANPGMPADQRRSTLLVLERFQLDRADFTLMRNAADALARQAPTHDHQEGL